MRQILSQLTQEQISRKSATLSQSIAHIINTHEGMPDVQTIALFAAHGTEVNWRVFTSHSQEKHFYTHFADPRDNFPFIR